MIRHGPLARAARALLWGLTLAWGGGLLGVGIGCNRCPKPVDGWQDRMLTVQDMEEAYAPWREKDELARDLYAHDPGCCDPAPIGIDPRVGLPVYLRLHCDDICPDQARFLLTYGDAYYGGEACDAIGMCSVMGGADPGPAWCTPISIGGPYCRSADDCNWNGACEPELGETPDTCPKECTCGDGITGPVEDRLAAEIQVFTDPATAPPDYGCLYDDHERVRNLIPELGDLYASWLGAFDLAAEAQRLVSQGRFPLLLRIQAPDLAAADYAALRATAAAPLAAPPRLDGTDVVPWPGPVADLSPLCGSLTGSDFNFGRYRSDFTGTLALPFPGLEQVALPMAMGYLDGTRDASGWSDVHVNAWVPTTDALAVLPGAIAAHLNALIDADPAGPAAASLAVTLDGRCDPDTCPDEVPGAGECAASDPPRISPTEVRCQPGFQTLLSAGTGLYEALTDFVCYAYRIVHAVPVTAMEP